jgi:hypothetical protein
MFWNKDFAAKFLPPKPLLSRTRLEFFSNLDPFRISDLDRNQRQIFEFKGLRAKIFINNDLVFDLALDECLKIRGSS